MIERPAAPRRPVPPVWQTVLLVAVAAVVGGAFALASFGLLLDTVGATPTDRQGAQLVALALAELVAGVVALALLPWIHRRAHVVPVTLTAVLAGFSVVAFLVAAYGVVAVATTRRTRAIVVVATALVVAGVGTSLLLPDPTGDPLGVGELLIAVLAVAAVLVLVGLVRGHRAAAQEALRHEAAAAVELRAALTREREAERRTQEARVAEARSAERARIAREMHDTLSHHLSLIAVHAGALEYRTDLDARAHRAAAATIAEAARQAGVDLRQVLAVLREDADPAQPLPDLTGLTALVDAHTGGEAVLVVTPPLTSESLEQLPRQTSRHLYRIAQEGLTNARKHAPGAPVRLTVTGGPSEGVTLELRNPLPAETGATDVPGSGSGLTGIEERARLSGGWCRAGQEADEFVVRAWVPWA